MNDVEKYMTMLSKVEELAVKVRDLALELREWDPDGACSRSMACALLDVETAYENISGEELPTPSEVTEILKEDAE